MLQLAGVGPQDTVYDLGCGDGRIVVTAARDFGAKGVGVELDPQLAATAANLVKQHNLQDRVSIICKDAAAVDVSNATVLALYLSDQGNQALLRAVGGTLRPGTKVVSLYFPVRGWEQHLKKTDTSQSIDIHLYAAPDRAK
jgi:cyclopropane fatty-acyl-phospholipid synthase-like methyltransferase